MTDIITYKIPYDVDILWDSGCNGTDWLWDENGENVLVKFSEHGSVYIRPEGSYAWQIYRDPFGNEMKASSFPGNPVRKYEHITEALDYEEVLECALVNGINMNENIFSEATQSIDLVKPPKFIDGAQVAFGNTEISFDEDKMEFQIDGLTYYANSFGKIVKECEYQALMRDTETMRQLEYTREGVCWLDLEETLEIKNKLEKESGNFSGLEAYALESAIQVFKRAEWILNDLQKLKRSK